MPDTMDRAQLLEERQRDQALIKALGDPHRRTDVCFRIIACIDCDDPIDPERLAARPEAIRCITCQEALERFQHLHPGT